jgi:hypothetical protein
VNGVKKLAVFKKRPYAPSLHYIHDLEWIWSELVWMYWEKQQEDGEEIEREKIDLYMHGDKLYHEFVRMRRIRASK